MKLKVLKNDLQVTLGNKFFLKHRHGSDFDLDDDKLLLYPIIGSAKRIPPVFNRVGFYLMDNKTCWYEFQLPSGRFVGIEYEKESFDYQLERYTSDENPISEEEVKAMELLIRGRRYSKLPDWYVSALTQRSMKRMTRDMGLRLLPVRRKVRQKRLEKRGVTVE